MLSACVLATALIGVVHGQFDAFALPQGQRYAAKPTVPPEFSKFFELDGHARELVDSLLGPRPGGLFPEKTYEIGAPEEPAAPNGQPVHVVSKLEKTLEQFFTAPETPAGGQALPPGFNSGFSLLNNNKALTSFGDVRRAPENEFQIEGSGEEKSSIQGIPKVFPKLPKAPVSEPEPAVFKRPMSVPSADVPSIPTIASAPEVPEGGFLPADIRRSPASVSEVAHSIDSKAEDFNGEEYGGLSDDTSSSSGGLIGTILNLITLGSKNGRKTANGAPTNEDKDALGKAVSGLLGGENSPLPAKNMISNVLYKALTSGSVQSNETTLEERKGNESVVLTPAQSAAISENLEMIQNLIIQPSSPLCTSKPEPVEFNLESFMGQWYQVVYSPPLSTGPCSMVAYKKLSDVGNGGVGSIFEVFQYTTDGTPYGKPVISSGYSIVKSPGELIYRTTNNQDDVTVHVLHVGPLNDNNQYEYAIMSTNCNFPLYVFARDAVTYKQKYETEVTEILETKGLVNGFSRILNIVAPVDNSMCVFPPSLFNIQG
ncbi:unnamed protein product [Caenorhabditis auriculariae]|uniref:Lipocalin domain-containing protein n=1 Tax=Caenorhabditis auriculariae TaxID=2777116 RepID=A0A8S1HCS1_9PELO|nr:unnamed protein product [Caenorhabditis auriculariae]